MTWMQRMGSARLAPVENQLGTFTITDATGATVTAALTPTDAVQWVNTLTDALALTGVKVLPRRKES